MSNKASTITNRQTTNQFTGYVKQFLFLFITLVQCLNDFVALLQIHHLFLLIYTERFNLPQHVALILNDNLSVSLNCTSMRHTRVELITPRLVFTSIHPSRSRLISNTNPISHEKLKNKNQTLLRGNTRIS